MNEDGTTSSGHLWETGEGILKLMLGDSSFLYAFNGLDINNGVVRAVGKIPISSPRGTVRAVMHEEKALGDRWGVRISSHVRYVKEAVPPLLKSLKKADVSMSRVMVAVGGSKSDACDYHDDDGVTFLHTTEDHHGLTALPIGLSMDEVDYVVCLHDTCDVTPDFVEKISAFDIGLNPDIISFCNNQAFELGIFAMDFLDGLEFPRVHLVSLPDVLRTLSSVVVNYGASEKCLGKRDVYGTGVQREEISIPTMGIKKFRGDKATGGKP